jgi:phosphatidylinositol dimannoside acyltransferase
LVDTSATTHLIGRNAGLGERSPGLFGVADLYRWAARVLPYVPPALGYPLCERLGYLGPWFSAWHQVLDNLGYVLPGASVATREQCARGVMASLFKNYFDLLRLHAISPQELERLVEPRGIENLKAALQRGKGAVVALPHIGNISYLPEPMAARLDRRIMTVVEQVADPRVQELVTALRRRKRTEIVPISPRAVHQLMQALRAGDVVALANDRTVGSATVEVEFFGAPARLPSGPAMLALRTGAPLLTAFTYREADNRSIVVIDLPIVLERSGRLAEDVYRLTQAVARVLESYIRYHPAQWLITAPVWNVA